MADIFVCNKANPSGVATQWFPYIWFVVRVLLKAGWRHKASSDGANKTTTESPETCKWGTPLAIGGQTGAVASIGAQAGKDFHITGLTGLVSPTGPNSGGSEGNTLSFTGAASAGNNSHWLITRVVGVTECYARPIAGTTGVANDVNNGAISWTEKSYLTTAYPAAASSQWILLQGPTTLKIPFTTAPTGSLPFFRGENVVQATTLAEGECLGVTFEPTTGVGYMVVSPRLQGSGSDPEGWNHADEITGAMSGAKVTPSAAPIRFIRELMIQRGTGHYDGTMTYQCIDDVGESASRLSTLAASAGCTATIAPGQGGTGNAFPTAGSYAILGSAGLVAHWVNAWNLTSVITGNSLGNAQYFAANCIDREDVSQDGSYTCVTGQPSVSTTSTGGPAFFMRTDGGEEGDVEPYFWNAWGQANSYGVRTRTAPTQGSYPGTERWMTDPTFMGFVNNWTSAANITWKRRGLGGAAPAADEFVDVIGMVDASYNGSTALLSMIGTNGATDVEKVQSTAMTAQPVVIEFPRMNSYTNQHKVRKGVPRHIGILQGNLGTDTFGAKAWLQAGVAPTNNLLYSQALVVRWDGSTTPVL
jgi:hypothetical protein